MMPLFFRPLLLLLLSVAAVPVAAQSLADYSEFYRLMRINAREQVVFCYPTTTPESEPEIFAVRRDTLGRPVAVGRFFFGNLDTRSGWAKMEIGWGRNDSTGIVLQRRRYLAVDGRHVPFGYGWGEDVISRASGELLYRRLVDEYGEPMRDVPLVTMTMYHDSTDRIFQEWFYGNGKQYVGAGPGADNPLGPFTPMPASAYYRVNHIDSAGNLIGEEALSFERERLPFADGSLIRAYQLNEWGLPVMIFRIDPHGLPTIDDDGIATEELVYDDHGRLVEWRAYDLQGAPRARRDNGVAAFRRTYRPFDGIMLSEERFDTEGNAITEAPPQ